MGLLVTFKSTRWSHKTHVLKEVQTHLKLQMLQISSILFAMSSFTGLRQWYFHTGRSGQKFPFFSNWTCGGKEHFWWVWYRNKLFSLQVMWRHLQSSIVSHLQGTANVFLGSNWKNVYPPRIGGGHWCFFLSLKSSS